nr:hypothetical protein [Tanacetum cinerariifolium]
MQLIASVLSVMQIYWASVFFLHKTIIKEIDSLLKSFMWSQGEKVNGKAKIAWKNVKWVNMYKLKGRNVWEVPIDDNASWGWRKLLELREQVRPHIRHCLGNGEDTNMWHDCWCDIGPIDKVVTRRQIYSAGFLDNATNEMDKVRWLSKDNNMVNFSIQRVWKDLRHQHEKVSWYIVVWFTYMIPRHAFIVWLMMYERLHTQDRIAKWYPNKNMKCSLCNEEIDSHDHLFINCKYAAKIWEEAKRKCQLQNCSNDWKDKKKDWKEVWGIIKENVKMKMISLKVVKTDEVTSAYNN